MSIAGLFGCKCKGGKWNMKKIVMMLLSLAMLVGCSGKKVELNTEFHNDEESRKMIYENGKEPVYEYSEYDKELINENYLTFQVRGTSLPDVHVVTDNNKMTKALDSEFNLVYERIEKDGEIVEKTSITDKEGLPYLEAMEFGFYDEQGKLSGVESYSSSGGLIKKCEIRENSIYWFYDESYARIYEKDNSRVLAYIGYFYDGVLISRELDLIFTLDKKGRII